MQTLILKQLFLTEQVAKNYGVTRDTIKKHKLEHIDEIIENLHFIVDKNDRNRPLIKWTLRGIIKLGMFIRSPQAKAFRLWAEQELEKSINAELEKARLAQEQNLMLENELTQLERRNAFTILGYKSQLAQQKERNNLVVKALECELALKNKELEQKQNINYDNPSPELKKALAERGKILMGNNDFNDLGEHLATKICISLREILGTNYPPCFKQLIDIVFMESRNYFTRKTHIYQNKPYTLESFKIKRADNSYSPIYGKWIIEDGKQIKGWELELKWKGDKKLSYGS